MAKKRRSLEEQIEHAEAMLLLAFEIWEYIRNKGCRDPFYPDGENMNLERQHIMSYKEELENLCKESCQMHITFQRLKRLTPTTWPRTVFTTSAG